jgi:serine/threonine-protein kinase RsbW
MTERTATDPRHGDPTYACRSWPAHPRHLARIRMQVRRWLEPLGIAEEAKEDIVLAASEAAANSVEHAYPGPTVNDTVELNFWTEPDAVCVEIVDHGVWQTPPTERRGRGRGIAVMRQLMETVRITHGPAGTRVLLRCAMLANVFGRNGSRPAI